MTETSTVDSRAARSVPGRDDGATTTQKGRVVESIVAASLVLASNGRLSPYLPFADDDGIDLILFDKCTSSVLPVQVKGWAAAQTGRSGVIQFDIRKATIRPFYRSILLAIRLDPVTYGIQQAWTVPMEKVAEIATEKDKIYAMCASTRAQSRDRCSMYRSDSLPELTRRLTGMLNDRMDHRHE